MVEKLSLVSLSAFSLNAFLPLLTSRRVAVPDLQVFRDALRAACKNVIAAEPEITQFDTIAGDGDCGLCLKSGAEEILRLADDADSGLDSTDVINSVLALAQAMERKMDGTSGALYSIWTNALAAGFATSTETSATPAAWSAALGHALTTLYKYTSARAPSRTLIDPLAAFTESFTSSRGQDLAGAVEAAVKAAEHTRTIEAKAGRAAYVGQDALREANVPDPGAWGVVKILEGIQSVVQK
jgi:dihydroxyacetone kinase